MERRKFTREFKLEAVRLIKNRGVSYVQASQDLSVHTSQLRDWVKKFSDDPQHAFPSIRAGARREAESCPRRSSSPILQNMIFRYTQDVVWRLERLGAASDSSS
jgi:transposase-like protein